MIVARLTGGLGNQMFQYAAARAVADRLGTEVLLDTTWYSRQTLRRYELGAFPRLRGRPLSGEEVHRLAPGDTTAIEMWGLWHTDHLTAPALKLVLETGPQFDPAVLNAPDDSYLVGYWQSEQYFEGIAASIRSDLSPPIGKPRRWWRLLPQAVAVHVRRSDYVTNPKIRETLGPLSADYYARAADVIRSRSGNRLRFLVFSDDIDWCRRHLRLPGSMTFEKETGSAEPTLAAMCRCRHHVIANSSFSWWGAWLSPHADKVIVAPDRWAVDPRYESPDRIPASWLTA